MQTTDHACIVMMHIFVHFPIAYYVWKLFAAVIELTTMLKFPADTIFILMNKWKHITLMQVTKETMKYINTMAVIFRKVLCNIFYCDVARITTNKVLSLIQENYYQIIVYN